ncbi:MAG TPA: hypothetical protein VNO82_17590 [Solirubrobacteraceae bacterium]|nr:hypothetical protein [Solirubrobacteraceae bacterium]
MLLTGYHGAFAAAAAVALLAAAIAWIAFECRGAELGVQRDPRVRRRVGQQCGDPLGRVLDVGS